MFRSEFFFRTTQELEYLFFLSRNARNFFPEFNIRLYDKNSESDYFFFLHQNQNIFLEKNHNPPPPPPFKLNGCSLMIKVWTDIKTLSLLNETVAHSMIARYRTHRLGNNVLLFQNVTGNHSFCQFFGAYIRDRPFNLKGGGL